MMRWRADEKNTSRAQVTYKDRLSYMGSATEAEWKPIRRINRTVPSVEMGMQQMAVNETEPSGILFVMRPPDLRAEPLREDHVEDSSSDDSKMALNCERIRKVRKGDLSEQSLAFWEAMEKLHTQGRYAASVPSLPHTINVAERSFSFEGCPQPLRPLLCDLMRFERPLITWDLFHAAPPAEFQAPCALQLTGPADGLEPGPAPATVAAQLAITSRPNTAGVEAAQNVASVPPSLVAGSAARVATAPGSSLPIAQPRVPAGAPPQAASATLPPVKQPPAGSAVPSSAALSVPAAATCQAASSSSMSSKPMRDPRVANTVSHAGYPKSQQARHGVELGFEEWTKSFPGRVEKVHADRLYIVKLAEADGEMYLGLIATEGKVFDKVDKETGTGERVPHIKALWFGRSSEKHAWGANPEFGMYPDGNNRATDDLPTESCLIEVEDGDLTDGSIEHKWSKPKLRQTFMEKLRWIANKYNLVAAHPAAAKRQRRTRA